MRQELRVRDGIYLTCHMLDYPLRWICWEFLTLQSQVTMLHTGIKCPPPHTALSYKPCPITLNGIVLEIVREYSIHAVASQDET